MFGFDASHHRLTDPILAGADVYLRVMRREDFVEWRSLRELSRAHLTRWEPDWTPADMTEPAFMRRLRSQDRDRRVGASLPLVVCERVGERLVGGVSLSAIRYHAARTATVGYWTGAPYLRKGYGAQAVSALVDFSFGALALNRIEAACQPDNHASARLLERCGFREEGYARDYLYINGAWRDHRLFAATASDWREKP